jgi:hypothetical protein
MCTSDVTPTLDHALAASGLESGTVLHLPRLANGDQSLLTRVIRSIPDGTLSRPQGGNCTNAKQFERYLLKKL